MSKLLAVDPLDVNIKERLKLFVYGAPGVGKTLTSLAFPKPYYIDTESGGNKLAYRKILKESGGSYLAANDYDQIIGQIRALMSEKHDYKTLIIDPITVLYHDLIANYEKTIGTDYGKSYQAANKDIRRLSNLLMKLDMNVVVTAYAKPEYKTEKASNGKTALVNNGNTFDCPKPAAHIFDLLLEIGYSDKNNKQSNAYVKKTRYQKDFPMSSTFPFSYESLSSRYDGDCLNAVAEPVKFASKEQVAELTGLTEALHWPVDKITKWLVAAGADSFEEMTADQVQKCTDLLKKQIPTTTNSTED